MVVVLKDLSNWKGIVKMNYKKVLMIDESMEDLVNELIANIDDILESFWSEYEKDMWMKESYHQSVCR